MSTQGNRDLRPKLHFTPPKMWTNDPNGMVYENGRYHLFYQHYPEDTVWGPMHWGHAVSEDLVRWKHLPVALCPDELGMIFSGSAVYDEANTSGFGAFGKAPIVLMYTSHGDCEQQSIAYSIDGVHFEKYDGNPVIPNPGIKDFRDPKMFWNPVKHCWSMVLAAADRVHFYSSPDLIHWNKVGEFGPEGNHMEGVWECPDLVRLQTEEGEKWVLLVSMTADPDADGRSKTQYFIGDFDGDTFHCTEPFDEPVFMEAGFDNYAGVTFQNADQCILMAWGMNWRYAADTPTGEYCGQMTFARRLSLVKTPKNGYRLAVEPVGVAECMDNGKRFEGGETLTSEVFGVRIEGCGACEVTLSNERGETLRFGVDGENALFADRTKAGVSDFNEKFASEPFSVTEAKRFYEGEYVLEAIFDVSIVELYADHGTRSMTLNVYPHSPYTHIDVKGSGKSKIYAIQV